MPGARVKFRVGVAGWSIPREDAAAFGEGESVLARYATRLSAVEVNSSFYRPHRRQTYARWAASVPAGFRFSVKMPGTISHELGLRGAGAALDRFLEEVGGLGGKLGGLLLQLPPSLAFDGRQAAAFFALLRRRTGVAVTCEPRHASWFDPRAEDLLRRYRIGRAAADPARLPGAGLPAADPRWTYYRWHGAPRMYYSRYDEAALQALARALRGPVAGRREAWVVFDNTAQGFAVRDALRLQALLAAAG